MRQRWILGTERCCSGTHAVAAVLALGLLVATLAAPLEAADWPQWRGPNRDGISTETGWLARWPASGPRRLWTAQVGEGYSSVAVKDGRVYTMGNAGERDTVYCLAAGTGRVLWKYSYPCPGGDQSGTRATPTVDGDRVYTLSREGQAFCLNASSGARLWGKDLVRETGAEPPRWGFAGSPLVSGKLVIYNVGTAGAALDRATGQTVWKSGAGTAGYASPVAYTVGGQRGVAIFTGSGLVGVDPATGRSLWQHPWRTDYDVNAADPLFSGDTVFISSNYERGGALLRLGPSGRTSVLWENRNMRNHFNTCVLLGGYLYGNDQNTLKCIDLRNGAERWRQRGMGKGGLIAVDGHLLVLTERGTLVLSRANPEQYSVLSYASVMRGTCWTQPVIANGLIYCRNHEGELICLDVRAGKSSPAGTKTIPGGARQKASEIRPKVSPVALGSTYGE
jgi:outer membrane protein assembly factor BamB